MKSAFSLLELIVVLLIIGIITTFSLRGLQNYSTRSEVIEAKHYMLQILQAQQQYFNDNFAYSNQISQLNMPNSDQYWNYQIEDCDINAELCFVIIATHQNRDATLRLYSHGEFEQ